LAKNFLSDLEVIQCIPVVQITSWINISIEFLREDSFLPGYEATSYPGIKSSTTQPSGHPHSHYFQVFHFMHVICSCSKESDKGDVNVIDTLYDTGTGNWYATARISPELGRQ
jgi:hypothetical protein